MKAEPTDADRAAQAGRTKKDRETGTTPAQRQHPWWVSFYANGERSVGNFEMVYPWWVSGMRCGDEAETVCCAVLAETEDDAKRQICDTFDEPTGPADLEWRFCEPKPKGWAPFSDRFERADWMVWPT